MKPVSVVDFSVGRRSSHHLNHTNHLDKLKKDTTRLYVPTPGAETGSGQARPHTSAWQQLPSRGMASPLSGTNSALSAGSDRQSAATWCCGVNDSRRRDAAARRRGDDDDARVELLRKVGGRVDSIIIMVAGLAWGYASGRTIGKSAFKKNYGWMRPQRSAPCASARSDIN